MRTTILAAAVSLGLSLGAGAIASGESAGEAMTGAAAVEALLAHSDGFNIGFPEGQQEAIIAAIERDAQVNPKDARLALGMALIEQTRDNPKAAREAAERAVELDPNSALAQYWLGNAVFGTINDAGMLEKASLASKGKKAYEKAVELDPNLVPARYAMAQFYIGAPGIAGGSTKKAREQAEALLTIDGGAFYGQSLLGQLAAKDKKWADMEKAYAAALAAAEEADADDAAALRRSALMAWSWSLIDAKKDPAAALPVIERMATDLPPDDPTALFLRARALQGLERWAEAAADYRAALALRPEAVNSGFYLGLCLEESGDKAGALEAYEAFIERHPDEDRVGEAKKAVKRLKKALGQ